MVRDGGLYEAYKAQLRCGMTEGMRKSELKIRNERGERREVNGGSPTGQRPAPEALAVKGKEATDTDCKHCARRPIVVTI